MAASRALWRTWAGGGGSGRSPPARAASQRPTQRRWSRWRRSVQSRLQARSPWDAGSGRPSAPSAVRRCWAPCAKSPCAPERWVSVDRIKGTGQVGQGTLCMVGHTRSRSRSACRRCRQKRMEGSEWGRVTGSPQTKSRTTAPSTSATFSAQKASVGHSHCVHPHGSSVQGWGQ